MSQTSTLKGQRIAEFLGTGLLIFFGVGCVAVLKVVGVTFDQQGISVIWGLGVAVAIYLTAGVSGAHLNPVVAIVLWLSACLDKRKVVPFIISQIAGAFCVAALVYGPHCNLFLDFEQTNHIVRSSTESLGLASTSSTYPNPHINFVQALAVETVVAAILMGLILALADDRNGIPRGPLTPLLIGLLTAVIGASMGPLTGSAMNPARDFGSKLFAWMAGWGETAFTGGRDILYSLVPVFGPIISMILGARAYHKLIGRHLLCGVCTTEEKDVAANTQQKTSQQCDCGVKNHG